MSICASRELLTSEAQHWGAYYISIGVPGTSIGWPGSRSESAGVTQAQPESSTPLSRSRSPARGEPPREAVITWPDSEAHAIRQQGPWPYHGPLHILSMLLQGFVLFSLRSEPAGPQRPPGHYRLSVARRRGGGRL